MLLNAGSAGVGAWLLPFKRTFGEDRQAGTPALPAFRSLIDSLVRTKGIVLRMSL